MSELPETRKLALEHGWNWFKYHAEQRITMVRFYLVIVAASATGFFGAIGPYPEAAAGASLFGFFCSLLFWRLDSRVSYLIKVGEAAISEQETYLASVCDLEKIDIIQRADKKTGHFLESYSQNLRVLFAITALLYFLATAFAVSLALAPASKDANFNLLNDNSPPT